jgi:hypothetical protein
VSEPAATTVSLSKEWGICQYAVSKAEVRGKLYAEKVSISIDRK